MNKRILSFILFVTVIMSASLLPVSSYAEDVAAADEYVYERELLTTVCPDLPLPKDGVITRSEFVASVVKLLNMPASSGVAPFEDVPANHKFASEINHGVSLGFINSQNMFYPDSPITYVQAMKIATIAIGYEKRAEIMGGYPTGYIRAAKEAEICEGLNLGNDDHISYDVAAKILYDMALANILEITSYGETYEYSTQEGKNILSLYHKVFCDEGIVDANEYTGLFSKDANTGKGAVSVEGVEFAGSEFYNLIGQRVKVFYKDDSKRTVVYAFPWENDEKKFSTDDSLKITDLSLEVQPEDPTEKTVNYKLSHDYVVIYNGKNLSSFDFNPYINPKAGSVAIIDNDDDKVYDVIVIEDIQYGFVERVNVLEKKIYDKYRKQGMLDMSDPNASLFIYNADGTPATLDAVEPNMVVGYITSKDNLLCKVKIYDGIQGGNISEKTSDGLLKVRDNYFELSDYYTANIKTLNEVKLGTDALCYLGEGNDIVYIEEVTSFMEYGYLVDIVENSGLDSQVFTKIMDATKGMTIFTLAKKVNVNGSVKSASDAKALLNGIIDGAEQYRAIKYALNEDGELVKVYSAVDAGDISCVYDDYTDESAPKVYVYNKRCYWRVGLLSPYIYPSGSTPMISIAPYTAAAGETPAQIAENTAAHMKEDDTYNLMTTGNFETDGTYCVTAFDVDASGVPKFMIVHEASSGGAVTTMSSWAVVEKVTTTLHDEVNVPAIKVFSQGKYGYYYIGDESGDDVKAALNTVKPGDILRITYVKDGELTGIVRDFDGITKKVVNPANDLDLVGAPFGKELEYINGYAYSLKNGYAMIVHGSTDFTNPVTPDQSIIVNLSRATTVFVKLNKGRNGNVKDAEVHTEPNFSKVETWYNAGTNADYIVSRQRFRDPYLNVIYID